MTRCIGILLSFLLLNTQSYGQQTLTADMLEQAAFRFSLTSDQQLTDHARTQWVNWIDTNQYVGLAEVHNSAQLSYFTKALLNVLHEQGFQHFAMEMGPNTAAILQKNTTPAAQTATAIKGLNRQYGKKSSSQTPLIFVNKVEDAAFVEVASRLGYTFWGLDQEFAGSYEMLLDQLYQNNLEPDAAFEQAYQVAKSALRKVIFKSKYKGQPVYCWYSSSEELNAFFALIKDPASLKLLSDMQTSWDIYCKSATGQGSNQQRANYMKKNLDEYHEIHGADARVFVKLGNVHLTHGRSPFGVDDVGKYLTEKSSDAGFLIVRHLITYRNGKSNVDKSAWKSVNLFLQLGRKDQWTVVDLRPFREMLDSGELVTDKHSAYELRSYDLLLISPDDQYPKVNY